MNYKEKLILLIIILISLIPILLNEIKEYNLRKLKLETLKISEILKNEYDEITQININSNEIVKDNIKTRGVGKAFVAGENVTVILSYKGYCSVKIPGIEEVALAKSKCQHLELINNIIIPIVEKDGLVKIDNNYYYKGENVDNYIVFNNEYYRILSFENNRIKIIKERPINKLTTNEWIEYLNKEYVLTVDNNLIDNFKLDISEVILEDAIRKNHSKTIDVNIGILSIFDYLNTMNNQCTIKDNNLICSKSFASKSMLLSNKINELNYYLYDDGNIYTDNNIEIKDIYPVIVLKEDTKIINGIGTIDNPYQIQ